jgi:ABC-type branched-subunit amino acid transport system substrate-binding protein
MVMILAMVVVGCAPAPAPAPVAKVAEDPVTEEWYGPVTAELAAMNRQAEGLVRSGKGDEAAAVITKGQALAGRLLAAPRPTLGALEAASDLDQMYAGMLMGNKNYGWARLAYQKNVSRWKNWRPQTAETARRLKLAQDGIAECDRRMGQ